MTITSKVTKNGQRYYYQDGKRISAQKARELKGSGSRIRSASPKKLAPCKSHQERNANNRCVNKPGHKRVRKSPTASPKKLAPCKTHQERNANNRCVNKPAGSPKKDSSKRSSPKRAKKELVPCKPHQERNANNRCVNKPGHKRVRKPKAASAVGGSPPSEFIGSPSFLHTPRSMDDCVRNSLIPLKPEQIKVIQIMDNRDALLVVHGTGCGKTLSGVGVAECFLATNPEHKVIFVGPSALVSNFRKEMAKYGITKDSLNYKRYNVVSFTKFLQNPIDCSNSLLIVDEAQNLRNAFGKKAQSILNCAMNAKKRLLLTATPFINNLQDFIPIINMLYGQQDNGRRMVGTKSELDGGEVIMMLGEAINQLNLKVLGRLIHNRVDVVDCKNKEDFPRKIENEIYINMSQEYFDRYKDVISNRDGSQRYFKNPEAFYNGHRQAVNKLGKEYSNGKITAAINIIKDTNYSKTVIYTNWVAHGIKPIEDALRKQGISYDIFSGATSELKRIKMIKRFNEGSFNVLLVTKSGGEGLDLVEVRNVIIFDPPWNDAALQQIIGRAIRYRSHYLLPKDEQEVNIYKLILSEPEGYPENNDPISGDRILYRIVNNKQEQTKKVDNILRESSIK